MARPTALPEDDEFIADSDVEIIEPELDFRPPTLVDPGPDATMAELRDVKYPTFLSAAT